MTTWGDTTTIYSTIADESLFDTTVERSTIKTTTDRPTVKSSTRNGERETIITDNIDLGSGEGSADNDVDEN